MPQLAQRMPDAVLAHVPAQRLRDLGKGHALVGRGRGHEGLELLDLGLAQLARPAGARDGRLGVREGVLHLAQRQAQLAADGRLRVAQAAHELAVASLVARCVGASGCLCLCL